MADRPRRDVHGLNYKSLSEYGIPDVGETKEEKKLEDPSSVKRKLDVRDEKKSLSSAKKKLAAALSLDKSCNEDDVEDEELRCLRAELKSTEDDLKSQRLQNEKLKLKEELKRKQQELEKEKGKPNLGAAVALMDTGLDSRVKGVVRFVQVDDSTCVVDGTLDGLLPGKYGVYLHEFGDISAGCNSCGDILGKSLNKPVGEIGEITSTAGRAEFRVTNNNFKVWDIIGRSCVLHDQAQTTDNRLLCGIVARSAGLFQNTKRICACDGVPVWDERDTPVAGPSRKSKI